MQHITIIRRFFSNVFLSHHQTGFRPCTRSMASKMDIDEVTKFVKTYVNHANEFAKMARRISEPKAPTVKLAEKLLVMLNEYYTSLSTVSQESFMKTLIDFSENEVGLILDDEERLTAILGRMRDHIIELDILRCATKTVISGDATDDMWRKVVSDSPEAEEFRKDDEAKIRYQIWHKKSILEGKTSAGDGKKTAATDKSTSVAKQRSSSTEEKSVMENPWLYTRSTYLIFRSQWLAELVSNTNEREMIRRMSFPDEADYEEPSSVQDDTADTPQSFQGSDLEEPTQSI